ncbi:MAG: GTPase HflX, partial [Candidatus Electrothrix sp. AR4]|nr:GTPase HflX [Candidatus Electrothrix sp. AR4]
LHVIDVSNHAWKEQVQVVEKLLRELELDKIPCLRVYNKTDRMLDGLPAQVKDGVCICARDAGTLSGLLRMMERQMAG